MELTISVKELSSLYKIVKTFISTLDPEKIMKLVVKAACKITNAEASTLRLLDEKKEFLTLVSSYGVSLEHQKKGPIRVGESIAGLAIKYRKPQTVLDVYKDKRYLYSQYAKKAGLRSLLSMPMLVANKPIGVLSIYTTHVHKFSKKEKDLLFLFVSLAAIAVENARLFAKTEQAYIDTIRTLGDIVDSFDWYTSKHSERVRNYAVKIAEELKLPPEEIKGIEYAAYIHDIGKLSVNLDILRKPGPLNRDEWSQIVKHPIVGASIVARLEPLKKISTIIRHHHEKYGGGGYPDGLSKEAIPLGARILAIADAYDAMTSSRPYRPALSKKAAIEEMISLSGKQFDPKILKVFVKILKREKEI